VGALVVIELMIIVELLSVDRSAPEWKDFIKIAGFGGVVSGD
jgi:hypothetical protein